MKNTTKKIISLFSIIRGYNILALIAAQYLAAIFIFSKNSSVVQILTDKNLLYLIIATTCIVAGGYIINNFYDSKADLINRPIKSGIDNILSLKIQLNSYFILNFIGVVFSLRVSFKSSLFFSFYTFCIWLYSHKLKKKHLIGICTISCLTVTPFLILLIYYKNYSKLIFVHACYLLLVVIIREFIKDMENIQGSMISNYKTFTITFGEDIAKKTIIAIALTTIIPLTSLYFHQEVHEMKYYFLIAGITLISICYFIKKAKTKNQFRMLHNILKLLIVIGIISLLLIDRSKLLDKFLLKNNLTTITSIKIIPLSSKLKKYNES